MENSNATTMDNLHFTDTEVNITKPNLNFTGDVVNVTNVSIYTKDFSDVPSQTIWTQDTSLPRVLDNGTTPFLVTSFENNTEFYDIGEYYYGDEYMYPGYSFERPVYLYIWEILVIVTSLVNIIVISVLLQRKMRNSTNMILAAIAISDSLTGLVTLPTYIMAFQKFDPYQTMDFSSDFPMNQSGQFHPHFPPAMNNHPGALHPGHLPPGYPPNYYPGHLPPGYPPNYYPGHLQPGFASNHYPDDSLYQDNLLPDNSFNCSYSGITAHHGPAPSDSPDYYDGQEEHENKCNHMMPSLPMMTPPPTHKPVDGYVLTKALCRGFMISKYFLSKMFHTVSIFLTLFLAIQRFISVAYPFKSQTFFSVRNTMICCVIIFAISPTFHAFHLSDEKANNGMCQWELAETGCKGGCIYLWVMFFIRHFLPCMALITLTALFISELNKGERHIRRMDSTGSQVSRRVEENKRITIIVIAIVIVFLIPEVPYGAFLLYNAIEKTANNGKDIDLETNRAIHMVYELLLVLSFHANFYIYTMFNRRFRKTLKRTFIHPVRKIFGDQRRFSLSRSSTSGSRPVTRKTDFSLTRSGHELQALNVIDSTKSSNTGTFLEFSKNQENSGHNGAIETKFMESFSADITQNPESSELDALNAHV